MARKAATGFSHFQGYSSGKFTNAARTGFAKMYAILASRLSEHLST